MVLLQQAKKREAILEEQMALKDNVIAELEGRNSSLAMQVADAMQSTSRLMEIVKGKEEQSAVASQSIRVIVPVLFLCSPCSWGAGWAGKRRAEDKGCSVGRGECCAQDSTGRGEARFDPAIRSVCRQGASMGRANPGVPATHVGAIAAERKCRSNAGANRQGDERSSGKIERRVGGLPA